MIKATIKKPPVSNHGKPDRAREKRPIKDILLLRLKKTNNGMSQSMVAPT